MATNQNPQKQTPSMFASAQKILAGLILPFIKPTDAGSFGRLVCSFLIGISYWYSWRLGKDIPQTLLSILQAMFLYVFGSKVYDGVSSYKNNQLTLSANASVSLSQAPTTANQAQADSKDS